MIYDVDYFIKKFEAIPETMWTINKLEDKGKYCANGLCGIRSYNSDLFLMNKEGGALQKVFSAIDITGNEDPYAGLAIVDFSKYSRKAAYINNGNTLQYQQPTPKQRILAALYDIKKMTDIDTGGKVKERIVYVAIPETISKQAKELIEN